MVMKTFEATDRPIAVIFSNQYVFDMPLYQRPYAWTTTETGNLFDDLTGALQDAQQAEGTRPYFFGSMVLTQNHGSPGYQVIDGQQRLTTFTILFCVLRELAESEEARTAIDNYVSQKGDPYAGIADRFRLNLRERDQEFFREKVQIRNRLEDSLETSKDSESESQKNILENAKYLWCKLSKLSQSERDALTSFIVQQCYLVVVIATNRATAHRIFSVLNARGLDLLPTDILKSEVLGEVSGKNASEYASKWEDMEEELGRDDFLELFGHLYMIYEKKKPAGSLDEAFIRDILPKQEKGEGFIDGVLSIYKDAYQIIRAAAYENSQYGNKVNQQLRNLNRLSNTISFWIAPAMEFYRVRGDDGARFYQLIRDLERLTYGLLILSYNRDARRARYDKVVAAFEKGNSIIDEDTEALQLSDGERAAILEKLDGPLDGPRSASLRPQHRTSLLLKLDTLLAAEGATYDHKIITVEHVLPQNPKEDSEWLTLFPDATERERWTHRLANLVLLSKSKNSQAQNFEFPRKKTEYFQKGGVSPFAITTQVINETEWTPKVLKRRQEMLIAALKKEWRLD